MMDKISPMVNIIPPTPEEEDHDIDSEDKTDPTTCWQYAEDITKYHLEIEVSGVNPVGNEALRGFDENICVV